MLRGLTLALMLLGVALQPAIGVDLAPPPDIAGAGDANDVLLRRQQARALLASGDSGGAVRQLAKVTDESPDDADAWSDYALALADAGQFRLAAAAVARSIELNPQAFVANKVAVIVFERLGRQREVYEINLRLSAFGDRIAMYEIAETLLEGRGIPADPRSAVEWMRRAAGAGHFGAMARLAQIYRAGLYGQAIDPVLSASWAMLAEAE